MADLPTVVTASGMQPQSPAALRAAFTAVVAALDPNYTSTLPGTLIEDIASTDTAAVALMDQARVETVNSLTPLGANEFLLNQLAQIYLGQGPSAASNTSVAVVFTATDVSNNPIAGYVVPPGFTISDGTYQYVVQDAGVTGTGGSTASLTALAALPGTWAVPAGSVTQLVTSVVPTTVELSVTNPLPGTPGIPEEDEATFRAQVLQAGLAASQGMPRYLKTLLYKVSGVQQRLVSARQVVGRGWEIIVGGGDEYEVGNAILQSLFDVNTLVGSQIKVTGITQANPGVVTTDLNHGYHNGNVVTITGIVGMTALNGVPLTISNVTQNSFSIGVDTTFYPAWSSGGVCTPNSRNVLVVLDDYPDTYSIPLVLPPQQTVTIAATWNTIGDGNFVSDGSVAQLATPALIDYVNSVPVGQPMILGEMERVFREAVAPVLPGYLLTRLLFVVTINGITTTPVAGTEEVVGDPESYFFADSTGVAVARG